MAATLSIGELARRAGVATSTVRYYDRLGLVRATDRDGSGRRFGPEALQRLTIIKYFQQAGFTLDEMRDLLDSTSDWPALARQKRDELDGRIRDLVAAQELIDAALACGCADLEGCAAHAGADDGVS